MELDRLQNHDKLQDVAGHLLRMTNTPMLPGWWWRAHDDRYRSLTVGQVMLEALRKLGDTVAETTPVAPRCGIGRFAHGLVRAGPDAQTSRKPYERRTGPLARAPGRTGPRSGLSGRSIVWSRSEGADAAGKGAVPSGALARHWTHASTKWCRWQRPPRKNAPSLSLALWRHVPRTGHHHFDRTWYGRVLVERVEGFCKEPDWLRAYTEINDFEHELANPA